MTPPATALFVGGPLEGRTIQMGGALPPQTWHPSTERGHLEYQRLDTEPDSAGVMRFVCRSDPTERLYVMDPDRTTWEDVRKPLTIARHAGQEGVLLEGNLRTLVTACTLIPSSWLEAHVIRHYSGHVRDTVPAIAASLLAAGDDREAREWIREAWHSTPAGEVEAVLRRLTLSGRPTVVDDLPDWVLRTREVWTW